MNLYPRVLGSVLLPAYDRLKGRRYARHRALLDESQWWDAERIRAFQWQELHALLAHVFASVPYLRRKYHAAGASFEDMHSWDDFRRLPWLTREEVNSHRDELCSTAYTGKLLPHATGGSSGTPTRFFRTYESYDWRTAAKDRAYSWSGWRVGERSVYLWGAPVGHVSRRQAFKTQAFETVHRQRVFNTFSQSPELWAQIHAAIHRYRPTLIVGYVSSLEQFADFLSRQQLALPPVRAVIGAAEPLYASTRTAIESAFGAPVFNTYGSREFMSIAAECERRDGLHVHAENLVVETNEADADHPSEILVTDLHNYGMPFVRYAIGDAGTVVGGACGCGRGLPRLGVVDGRVLDMLRTADGRTVPGEFFPHLLKDVPELAEFRVEQPRPDALIISAVLNAPLSDRSQRLLDHEIGKVFGSATNWEIRSVTHLPKLASGKRRVTVGLAG